MFCGYVRTSRDEMNSENQERILVEAGVGRRDIYKDEGVSGRRGVSTRNGWRNLNSNVQDGDTLVVAEISRIGRVGGYETLKIIENLMDRGISLRFLRQDYLTPYLVATNRQEGMGAVFSKALIMFMGEVAKEELDTLIQRTKDGQARARAEGKQIGGNRALSPELEDALRLDISLAGSNPNLSALSRKYSIARATVRRIADDMPTTDISIDIPHGGES